MSLIKDELLTPYFIECEEYSYNVKLDTGKTRFDKKLEIDVPIYENKGYYSNKLGAFKKIINLKMNNSDESRTISEYFEEQNSLIRLLIERIGD